jgi:inner membrane protein
MIFSQQQTPPRQGISMSSTRLVLKAFAIAALTIVILIALFLISNIIDSRQSYRNDARTSIEESYAFSQTIVGPILIRPFTVTSHSTRTDEKGVKQIIEHTRSGSSWSFPHELNVTGTLVPSERRHGLYKVPVYELDSHLTGTVDVADAALNEGETAQNVIYGTPYFALGVTDVRGIVGSPKMTVNNLPVRILQGAPESASWQPNLQAPLRVSPEGLHGRITFALDLTLAGTDHLNIAPVADSNHIDLSSSWPSPLFAGSFLPRGYTVGTDGFKAQWDISSLASATQAQMLTHKDKDNAKLDLLEVDLITPVDPYKLSDRAVKYGILFVLITFGGFFVFEVMHHLPIHPVQYFLVGLGLAIFFLLLISFSEHMAFGAAYLLASAACIGLLTFYLTFVLRSLRYGLAFGSLLTLLYAGIYGLLISEDNALVLGSLMLFVLLALVMYVTRKVDWYKNTAPQTPPPPLPPIPANP